MDKKIVLSIIVGVLIIGGIYVFSGANNNFSEGNLIESVSNQNDMLKIETIVEGQGRVSKPGDNLVVRYTGFLEDGTKFDSNVNGRPFSFTLGAGQVIEGWEKGMEGMKVGEKRKVTIPSAMGYGEAGIPGVIPPNANLIFEVELLEID